MNTVTGMSGVSSSSARTRGSNATHDGALGVRTSRGGASDATALTTGVREIATVRVRPDVMLTAFGTPSA